MDKIDLNRLTFYEFLHENIDEYSLEKWIYENKELENIFPKDYYLDLISFNYRSKELKPFIIKLVKQFFDWYEFEKWRTIKLLTEIYEDKIEIILATRKLRSLYLDQEESIKTPLISVKLGIGYESVLDNCPIPSEYHLWNSEALKKQLEPIVWYKDEFKKTIQEELSEILNPNFKM